MGHYHTQLQTKPLFNRLQFRLAYPTFLLTSARRVTVTMNLLRDFSEISVYMVNPSFHILRRLNIFLIPTLPPGET